MTTTEARPTAPAPGPERRSGELNLRELLRFGWRQLTSMRTALILLLLLALAAVPGSVIPQERVDALKTGTWQDAHTTLTPIYQRLDLFNVYGSPWFAAIYLLLMVSLVGCIVPRTLIYLRGVRAQPPVAPRNLTRLRDHAAYTSDQTPEQVLAQARRLFRTRRYRLRPAAADDYVSAEKGYLREVGNLVFHLAVMVVLIGFAFGVLFGFKGGVILVQGDTFTNTPTKYNDFVPGSLFAADRLDPFNFTIDQWHVDWVTGGPKNGMPRDFNADMTYQASIGAATQSYDLRVNHPLTIGHTEVFLIGQGYAPVVTIKDAQGNVVYSKATPFLPESADLFSFGVIKDTGVLAPNQLGFKGFFYPDYFDAGGTPVNLSGKPDHPLLSLTAYVGDLGLTSGAGQSVYSLDETGMSQIKGTDGQALRINLTQGQTETLPNGAGSITFDGYKSWQRLQISQVPGQRVALSGVVLALIGLLGSLFIRSRRVWVRARPDGSGSVVEVAVLDRSGGADTAAVLSDVVAALQRTQSKEKT